jgi:hypothetical protein
LPREDHYQDITFSGFISPGELSRVQNDWVPSPTATHDLGTTTERWRNGYFSGNVDIAGSLSVTSSTYFAAPQTGSTAPIVLGDSVWPGSATGFCSDPAASANHLLFTPISPNASTIVAGTYYYVYTLGNENGESLQSAVRSVTIAAGEAFQPGWDITAGDYAFTTGCPKMRFYVGSGASGPFYLQTPRTRKVNLVSITRASNIVTAVTGVMGASGSRHGMVPGDRITVSGVTCGGGGACANSFAGTFELIDNGGAARTADGADASTDPNNQLVWAQTGANESGDATTGQMQDINWDLGNSWSYAVSNTGNRGPIFDVPFATSGTQPPSTNAAVIPALQVALNRTHSRLGSSDPDYFHGRKLKVRLPEKYLATLTTPLVMYETIIEGVHPGAFHTGNNTPTITSAIADPNFATVMWMGLQVEMHGVGVSNTHVAGNAVMAVGGGHSFNNIFFSNGYIGASTSASATGAALRLRATPISFNWKFDYMNFGGGRWNIWSDRAIISNATITNSRLNCGGATDSGAFRIYGGPDAPERVTGDGDGITSSVWIMDKATVTESCAGIQAYLTNSKLIMRDGAEFADALSSVGTEAVVKLVAEWWSEGSSAGYGLELYSGAKANSNTKANNAAGIKQVGRGATIRSVFGGMPSGTSSGTPTFIDANGLSVNVFAYQSGHGDRFSCSTTETQSGTALIINATGLNYLDCQTQGNGVDNVLNSTHTISGMTNYRPPSAASGSHEWSIGVGKNLTSYDIWKVPAATATNLGCRWEWNDGIIYTCFQNNGSTPLFKSSSRGSNVYVNFFNPGSGIANNYINVQNAIPLSWSNAAANAAKRFVELDASDNFILGEGTANEVRPRTTLTPFGSTSFRWNLFGGTGNFSDVITSTLATGTAPFTVASTTNVANLNASSLSGATFAAPGAIGGTTPASVKATVYTTATNCASSGGTCGSAAAGAVTIAAAATTVTVATTAVNAASRIFVFENSTLGTELSVTCNTTVVRNYAVTAVTAATSFVITTDAAPAVNPACLTYLIVN